MILGRFTRGQLPNQVLASAIFTGGFDESRSALLEGIWHPSMCDSKELLLGALQKGEDMDLIFRILSDGTLERHERVRTTRDLIDVCTNIQDDAPMLRDVLNLSKQDLLKRNLDVSSLPQTIEEKNWLYLEEAERLLAQADEQLFEEDDNNSDNQEGENDDDKNEENEENTTEKQSDSLLWDVPFLNPRGGYSFYMTVWYRINVPRLLLKHYQKVFGRNKLLEHKLQLFAMAHIEAAKYLDSLVDPSDHAVDVSHLCSLYTPLGESRYQDDLDHVQLTRRFAPVRQTPLQLLQSYYSSQSWTLESVMEEMHMGFIDVPPNKLEDYWIPVIDATPFEDYRIYYACLYIMQQCMHLMGNALTPPHIYDALWTYYASFTELFEYCLVHECFTDAFILTPMDTKRNARGPVQTYSDKLTPFEAFATQLDTRTFHAGDLPDLYHVLCDIPLWGTHKTPSYRIGKIYQKSLPFACQRRLLIQLIVKTIKEDEGFWRVFSRLMWVLLANLYPKRISSAKTETLGMRDLLRAKELCDSKALMIEALTADQSGFGKPVPRNAKAAGANGGPLLVFVAFRMHIVYMADLNPEYALIADKCINWGEFKSNTLHSAALIRESGYFPADPFAQARIKLSKTVKSPSSKVHRLRKQSMAATITDHVNDTLEKTLIRDKHSRWADLKLIESIRLEPDETKRLQRFRIAMQTFEDSVTRENMHSLIEQRLKLDRDAIDFYERILNLDCKARILNVLLRMHPKDRMTIRGFSLLTLPKYGGVQFESVKSMLKLAVVYQESAVPKKFRECIDAIVLEDFSVIAFYFNMVTLLEKISFVTLDADTIERTNHAMKTQRHHLVESVGQALPETAYNVCIALCCEKVCSLKGYGKLGAKSVSYDLERHAFVCTHGKALRPSSIQNENDGPEKDEDDEDGDDANNHEDEEDEEDDNQLSSIFNAQNDSIEDVMSSMKVSRIVDFTADAASRRGRGNTRHAEMESRKAVRNERKRFNRIPCHQPVLNVSLYGRALIWNGNTQVMFCPQCGALHVYSIINFSGAEKGLYRCNECAQKELTHVRHRRCAYCDKTTPSQVMESFKLPIASISNQEVADLDECIQWLYFCRTHYNIAKRYIHKCTKEVIWCLISKIERDRMLKIAAKK